MLTGVQVNVVSRPHISLYPHQMRSNLKRNFRRALIEYGGQQVVNFLETCLNTGLVGSYDGEL